MGDRHVRLCGLVAIAVVATATAGAYGAVLCRNRKTGVLSLSAGVCTKKQTTVTLDNGLAVTDSGLSAGLPAAAGAVQLAGADVATTLAVTPTTLDSFTVTLPGPGTLTVTVSGFYLIDADAPGTTSITVKGDLGLCDTANDSVQCGNTYVDLWYQDADDDSDVNTTPAFTLTRTVAVSGAGTRTFYLNGQAASPGQAITLWGDGNVAPNKGPTATAVYSPATLLVTRP
jgi:hypothetical protein